MAKIKPKDIKTKHKAGEYIYVRMHGKITSEYSIRRVLVKEIIVSIGESSVEIHYDAGGEMFPEIQTASTIVEAEALAIAQLAAHKLKGKATDVRAGRPKKKFKPSKAKTPKSLKGKMARRRKRVDDEDDDEDMDDDEEDIDDEDDEDDEDDDL